MCKNNEIILGYIKILFCNQQIFLYEVWKKEMKWDLSVYYQTFQHFSYLHRRQQNILGNILNESKGNTNKSMH